MAKKLLQLSIEQLEKKNPPRNSGYQYVFFGSIERLPNCCGVIEVGSFGLHEWYLSEDRVKSWPAAFAVALLIAMNRERVNAFICTTTQDTHPFFARTLAQIGANKLLVTTNPKTRNRITLWGFKRGR